MRRTLAALLLLALAGCAIPDRIEKRGNFLIEYYQRDAFGHISTRRAIYHERDGSRTPVTRTAVSFHFAMYDPDRLIYDTCDLDAGCALMYFDGHTGQNHIVWKDLKISMSPLDDLERWSWNGHFVAFADQYELVILNLESGVAVRPVDALRLNAPYYPDRWEHRELVWGKWGPDGAHASLFVHSPHGPGLPVGEWDQEVYSLDGATGALTMIGTHTGLAGVRRADGGPWRADDLRWEGTTLLVPR